jgi:hypothetical protein
MIQWFRVKLLTPFLMLTVILPVTVHAAFSVDKDFSLELTVNDVSLSEHETIFIDPDEELVADIYVSHITSEITLETLSVVVIFAGQQVTTLSKSLDNHILKVGDTYHEPKNLSTEKELMFGTLSRLTGKYQVKVTLDYMVNKTEKAWSILRYVRIPGNPISTPTGQGAAAATGVLAGAAIWVLARSLIAPGIAVGATVPGSTSISSSSLLTKLDHKRLESTARGSVMKNIVRAAKGRIVRNRCPLCEAPLRHGHCHTCRKSAKEAQKEYAERVKNLSLQAATLIAGGEITTFDELCSKLGIEEPKLGTDVLAVLKNSKLIKVKGIARNLMGMAIITGIVSGISTIVWITLGGFAALNNVALIAILAGSVVLPYTVTKGLQMKTGHKFRKN